jgi:putative tricarboxylic transport membrane protein
MADRVIFVCIIVLAAVYFYATQQIPSLEIGDPLGPKAFPRLLGIGLLVTAGLLFAEMWRARKNGTPQSAPQKAEDRGHFKVIGAVVVWTGIYLAFFELVGYVISTAVYLIALTAYFNRGKWVANVLTSVLFSVMTHLMFQALGVTLPKGMLPF